MRIHIKYTYRYTRASRVTYGEGAGYSRLPTMLPVFFFLFFLYTCVSVTRFSSLNSQLTAEAIGYVNVDKANTITGK